MKELGMFFMGLSIGIIAFTTIIALIDKQPYFLIPMGISLLFIGTDIYLDYKQNKEVKK